jgi:cGMP-dependent protein kinase
MGSICGTCTTDTTVSDLDYDLEVKHRSLTTKPLRQDVQRDSSLTRIYTRRKHGQIVDERRQFSHKSEQMIAFVDRSQMSQVEFGTACQALAKHSIFSSLDEEGVRKVVEEMTKYAVRAGVVIFEQGTPGNNFYVITVGECEVVVNDAIVNLVAVGQGFGELALVHNSSRTATVRTASDCELWGIDRKTFNSAVRTVNIKNYAVNLKFVQSVNIFKTLNPSEQNYLVQSLIDQKFDCGQRIVNEGEPGELFYLIKEGTVSCSQKGVEIRRLHLGDYFGEQALLYNCRRTATVTAVEQQVRCLSIGRSKLETVLGSELQQVIYKNTMLMIMEQSAVLSQLSRAQQVNLIDAMNYTSYVTGASAVRAGAFKGAKLIMVLRGSFKHRNKDKVYAASRTCIGDDFIMMPLETKFRRDLVAACDSDVAEIDRTAIEAVLGSGVKQTTEANKMLEVLKRTVIFGGLVISQLKTICSVRTKQHLRRVHFNDGQLIFEQGSAGNSFYIICEGNVSILKGPVLVRTITKLDYFGERSILFNEMRSASAVAQGAVVCCTLSQEEFFSCTDQNIIHHLKKRIAFQDESAGLGDLVPLKVLGKGMFGIVSLVYSQPKGNLYALKAISRSKIAKYRLYENTLMERRVLSQLDHMLVMKLVRTYRDSHFIYFLCEFVNGLDLFDVLRMMDAVKDSEAKFFIAGLLMILEHLHERKIVYRDLKPENVMIDDLGYPRLIDFGTAKMYDGRTFTIIGTPHYMAPEMILNKGYGHSVDFWSLGVMLYEFVCCRLPFGDDKDDPYDIYQAILKARLSLPSYLQGIPSACMIEALLDKDPSKRSNAETLKSNPWLTGFAWVRLT